MVLNNEQRKIGIKYHAMSLLSYDIFKHRYTELQQLYESLNLKTNKKLVNKLNEERNIAFFFTESVYFDILLVIADYIVEKPDTLALFEELYSKRFPYIVNLYDKCEKAYKNQGFMPPQKLAEFTENEADFFLYLIYRSEVFPEPDKIFSIFDFNRDLQMLNYRYYLSDKNYLDDEICFCTTKEEGEKYLAHTSKEKGESILNSNQFKKYLLKRRNELADYLGVSEKDLDECIHDDMRSHSENGLSTMQTGEVGLIENIAKNIVSNHNGGVSWYNNMTSINNSKAFDFGLHYVPDVKRLIENFYKSYIITRYIEETNDGHGFTKITLARECIPEDISVVYHTVLCMYEMDVFYKMFSVMQKQYYQDFSWEKIGDQKLAERYNKMIENLENIIERKELKISSLLNKNRELELQVMQNNSKEIAPFVTENNRLLKELDKQSEEIANLKKQLKYQEEFILELNTVEDEDQKLIYDLKTLQSKKYLFVGSVSDVLPELKHKFPNSLFMETATYNLSGIQPDAIIMMVKWMSHSMFYKIKSMGSLSGIKTVMCNTKNIDVILQKMFDELF